MRYQRPAIIGASVLAFGAAVAIMLPPTKPIGGAKIVSTAHQGFSPVEAAPPAENQPTFASAVPPITADPSIADRGDPRGDEPAAAEADPEDRDAHRPPSRTQASAERMTMASPVQGSRPMMAPRAAPGFAYADDATEDDGRDYKVGYRWARRADVQDWRDCRALAGAQIDGCRAYLRDMQQRRDGDEDEDRPY